MTASVHLQNQDAPHACEHSLLQERSIPLPHRAKWSSVSSADHRWFIAVRDEDTDECMLGFVAEETRLRALPGHSALRVQRFGGTSPTEALALGVRALAELARARPRVIRVNLEVHTRDEDKRAAIGHACRLEGFKAAPRMRSYRDTIAIDLRPELEEIFAGFHSTGRQNVRAVDKRPVAIRAIEEPGLAHRMSALLDETMERTAGPSMSVDWPAIIRFCLSHPGAARLVGLFDERPEQAGNLLAFALAYHHGDHVEYSTAASTRHTDLKLSLSYGLVWELMQWARSVGADWFDFGGVTAGSHGGQDRRGGISDFKRYFSRETVRVGEEWVLEPRPFRARIARSVGVLAGRARTLAGRLQ